MIANWNQLRTTTFSVDSPLSNWKWWTTM